MSISLVVKPPSLVEEVMQNLRTFVEREGLTAGDRLPTEQALIGSLGVSRTVLREAFKRLESTGLVSIERGRGTFVAEAGAVVNCARLMRTTVSISQTDLHGMIELRTALECQVARRCAERVTPSELAELKALLAKMCDDQHSREMVMNFDHELHEQMARIADCELLRTHLATIREFIMAAILRIPPPTEGVGKINRRMHRPILVAFEKRDTAAADRAMREHMQILGDRLIRSMDDIKKLQAGSKSEKTKKK